MPNTIVNQDKESNLSLSSEEPRVSELIRQFKMEGYQGEYWGRLRDYEDTRLAYWDGQSDDGKKHSTALAEGEQAFPWEGANDSRVYMADELCNEQSAIMTNAFWRSDLRIAPVGTDDVAEAARLTKFMNWLKKSKMSRNLVDEVDLSAQYTTTSGWCALDVTWDREIAYRYRTVKMENLIAISQKLTQVNEEELDEEDARYVSALKIYPETIMTVEAEPTAIELTKILYQKKMEMENPELAEDTKGLSTKEAKRVVRELRETHESEMRVPYLSKNEPTITTRKAYRDCVLPYEATRMDGNLAVFVRCYMTEDEVRNNVIAEDWDDKWVDLAVKTKGRETVWHSAYDSEKHPSYLWKWEDRRNELIEVIYAYKGAVDELGVRSTWMTIFSPHMTTEEGKEDEMAALHIDTGYPMFPIVEVTRERIDRSIASSRGIPEIVMTAQREEKVERDALCDSASIGVMPPVLVPRGSMGKRLKFGPATQNTFKPGSEPKFMDVPINGASLAIEHINLINARNARYFGRFDGEVAPGHSQLLMEPVVRRFLHGWAQAFKVAYCMCLKFAPELIDRVVGPSSTSSDDMDLGDYDFVFKFDVANLHPDLMAQKLGLFSELLNEDQDGVVLKGKLTALKARLIDPELADELIEDQGTASEAMYRRVADDMLQMFNGNEALYSDASNDPTAQAKYQFAVQIISKNMKYISSLDPKVLSEIIPNIPPQIMSQSQPDPIFSAYVQKYFDNLKQGVAQQQNKITGRTGVSQ